MRIQVGARWLATELHNLGAGDTTAADVIGRNGSSESLDVHPPLGFMFFDCIREERYGKSMTALYSLGFEVKKVAGRAKRDGDGLR